MCFHLFVHYTSAYHDTRPLCLLNPSTNLIVRNPYAEPIPLSVSCEYPCLIEPSDPDYFCPLHKSCCRLVSEYVCNAADIQLCPNSFRYHLRLDPVMWNHPLPPFRHPWGEQPWFVALRADLFQIGTEAVDLHRSKEDSWDRICFEDAAKGDGEACSTLVHELCLAEARYIGTLAYLAHLALVWDLNHEKGLCPVRPGSDTFDPDALKFLELDNSGFVVPQMAAERWLDDVEVTEEGVPSVAALRARNAGVMLELGEFERHYPPVLQKVKYDRRDHKQGEGNLLQEQSRLEYELELLHLPLDAINASRDT